MKKIILLIIIFNSAINLNIYSQKFNVIGGNGTLFDPYVFDEPLPRNFTLHDIQDWDYNKYSDGFVGIIYRLALSRQTSLQMISISENNNQSDVVSMMILNITTGEIAEPNMFHDLKFEANTELLVFVFPVDTENYSVISENYPDFIADKKCKIQIAIVETASDESSDDAPIQFSYDYAGNMISSKIISQMKASMLSARMMSQIKPEANDNALKIKLYPNPTTDYVNIEILEDNFSGEYDVSVVSLVNGRKFYEGKKRDLNFSVDMSRYPSDIYVLNIQAGNKNVAWKIIKR